MKSTLIEKHDLDRYLKIRELIKLYPNDMEFGGKVRELFWERDTAGHPVKKIDEWLTRDIEEQKAREIWICSICNKSTYDVDWDYIGSGTNHLGCELQDLHEKVNQEEALNK